MPTDDRDVHDKLRAIYDDACGEGTYEEMLRQLILAPPRDVAFEVIHRPLSVDKVAFGPVDEPWMWSCRDADEPWHYTLDDRGFAATQAEALTLACTHRRTWHEGPRVQCSVVFDDAELGPVKCNQLTGHPDSLDHFYALYDHDEECEVSLDPCGCRRRSAEITGALR